MTEAHGTGKGTSDIIIGTTIAGAIFGLVIGGLVAIFGSVLPGIATFAFFVVLFLCIGIAKATKLNSVLRTPPETATQFLQRSKAHIEVTGNYPQALADVSTAIDMDPMCVQAYTWRADMRLSHKSDIEGAADDLKCASELIASEETAKHIAAIDKRKKELYWAWHNLLNAEKKVGRVSHETLAMRWMIPFMKPALGSPSSVIQEATKMCLRIEQLQASGLASELITSLKGIERECRKELRKWEKANPINITESVHKGSGETSAKLRLEEIDKLTDRMHRMINKVEMVTSANNAIDSAKE